MSTTARAVWARNPARIAGEKFIWRILVHLGRDGAVEPRGPGPMRAILKLDFVQNVDKR